MKKMRVLALGLMLLFSAGSFANANFPSPDGTLSEQIAKLLSQNPFSELKKEVTAQVRFTLNREGEIVVLSVTSDQEDMAAFVKSRLNYQKVVIAQVEEGKLYTVPVRIAP
ncbi:hypothetical protein [Maribacter sp. 2307ULW6-5]|uniref:hypothetical protein n=1 Tax=Maribacter sp. 2307ULW6-5 TaxID=3386275 RepID=UPI0039BD226E